MIASAEGNYDNLGPLRAVFFRTINAESKDLTDIVLAAQLLVKLTADGRDISGAEADLAPILHRWLDLWVALVSASQREVSR